MAAPPPSFFSPSPSAFRPLLAPANCQAGHSVVFVSSPPLSLFLVSNSVRWERRS